MQIWKVNFHSRFLRLSELPRYRERPQTLICYSRLVWIRPCHFFLRREGVLRNRLPDDSRLSGLFTLVPPSPDNRGSTVPVSESFWSNLKFVLGLKCEGEWNAISVFLLSCLKCLLSINLLSTVVARLKDRNRKATFSENLAHCH